jgi:hypothetical protein
MTARLLAIVAGCALAAAPVLAACNATFRFDEPLARDAGDAETGTSADAAPPPERCTSDTACGGAGLRCETASGECVACLVDGDCSGAFRRCETSLHACVACLDTPDCGAKQRCEPTTHRCVDTCVDDDDPCPLPNFVCDRDRALCVECRSSANCAGSASGPVCDMAIGRCVECTANARCPMEKPACDRRTGRCVGCVSSAACGLGFACDPATLACVAIP